MTDQLTVSPAVEALEEFPAVVALGGGHGLAASLAALRRVTHALTAIVTVADNGGSSGRLRTEFDVLPPGDMRMALAALCGDDQWGQTWARVLQHRFSSRGPLDGHAAGNVLIVALWELLGDQVRGLDWIGELLGARGRVLPMATEPLELVAKVQGIVSGNPHAIATVKGQTQVASTRGQVQQVLLEPADPPACPEAVDAVTNVDFIVLGPGSWYSSVIPHFLVPQLRRSIVASPAKIIVTLNLEAQPGETTGFTPADHIDVLARYVPELPIDYIIADRDAIGAHAQLSASAQRVGAELKLAPVAASHATGRHDPDRLARAFADIFRSERPR